MENRVQCDICPRACKINDGRRGGYCSVKGIMLAKTMLHTFEEPVISGKNGSGAIFFSGCNLKCCYCQNYVISRQLRGQSVTVEQLIQKIEELVDMGADNINFVTPSHYTDVLERILVKLKLKIPVIYNSSGYDKVESLRRLDGLVQVYLPDFKYFDDNLAKKYSSVDNYFEVATRAIAEMLRQQREVVIEDGLIKRGVMIRHLVLPSHREDSRNIVRYVAENFKGAHMSIMSQYTPEFNSKDFKELNRRVTTFEYQSVVNLAQGMGICGFVQGRESGSASYTPDF